MLLGPTGVVRGVITQWGGQQPFQGCDSSEVKKHESPQINGAHPPNKVLRQRSKVEGQEERGHGDRELFQLVLRGEGVHLYPRSRRVGEHQIVQRAVLRGVRGERETILDDGRDTS